MKKTINIAEEFSRYPYGRSTQYSKTSGERFREEFILPFLNSYEQITIELDGTEGYGSSFLDEAFANLIRVNKQPKETILKKLKFVSKDDPSLIEEIQMYIEQAK